MEYSVPFPAGCLAASGNMNRQLSIGKRRIGLAVNPWRERTALTLESSLGMQPLCHLPHKSHYELNPERVGPWLTPNELIQSVSENPLTLCKEFTFIAFRTSTGSSGTEASSLWNNKIGPNLCAVGLGFIQLSQWQ